MAAMTRRRVLSAAALTTVLGAAGILISQRKPGSDGVRDPSAAWLPRWRGFNVNSMKRCLSRSGESRKARLEKRDFAAIAGWGFDFARLQLDFRFWCDPSDWRKFNDEPLRRIDAAIEWCETLGVHLCLNFYRAPGFTLYPDNGEENTLWKDESVQDVCAEHWSHLARRFRGVSSRRLSFNPLNEPTGCDATTHRRVIAKIAAGIRAEDPKRLIICDGRDWGWTPPSELEGLDVAVFARGFKPYGISHFGIRYGGSLDREGEREPSWPLDDDSGHWDRERLWSETILPWRELQSKGFGLMVGMFGAYQFTPHPVAIAWMRTYLEIWRQLDWGWALCGFDGSGGILNSRRRDVRYTEWRGRSLDEEMLNLLRSY